jgi:hypothetical protein
MAALPQSREESIVIRSRWFRLLSLSLAAVFVLPVLILAQESDKQLEESLSVVRGDIMARRDAAMQAIIQLDEKQAKPFRALKSEYDAELKKLSESRRALLKEYVAVHTGLTAEKATDLALRSLALDDQRNALRKTYFERMSKELSPVIAGQFLQLERQFETMADLKIATIMPVAGY